nr:unnamed protein product [Callosobruchus chinensis]
MHSNEKSGRFSTLETCVQCHAKFKSKAALHHHNIQTKHDIDIDFLEPTLTDLDTTLSTCIHCNATFKSKVSLDDHIIRKHPDFITSVTRKIFECAECYYKTSIKNNFKNHMSVHGFNYRLDPCSHCNATFKSKVSLDDHILKKHPEFVTSITRKIYKCSKCVYQTTVKNHFNDHMSVHPETATGCICMYCNASLKSKRALDDHMVRKHLAAPAGRKIFECRECSYRTIQKSYLANHMLTHKIHECSKCGYKTILKFDYDKHNATLHPETPSPHKRRECLHCDSSFTSRMALDNHVVKKHPDFITSVTSKLYECTECHYKTTMKHDFNRHTSMHQGTTPSYSVTCAHCNVKLKSKRALDDHVIRKHPDFVTSVSRKIHECSMCSYKTLHKSSFDKHMTTHTETTSSAGISRCIHCDTISLDDNDDSHNNVSEAIGAASSHKILNCALCNATFKTARGRDDHLVKQHPNSIASVDRTIHECTKCAYRTILKHDFDKHNVLIHPEILSPFKLRECIHCNATFKSRASLDDHTLRKHPDFIATITRKIYECINCIYKTTIKSHFNKHMSVHTENARGGICVQCNATFKSARALDDHVVKKHPNDTASVSRKIHECTKCSYKTIFRYDLDRHDASSHPEAVSCIHCNLILKTKAALDEHVVKKHPDSIASLARRIYECLQCFYKTTIKRNFDRHLSTHSEDVSSCELIQCDHCTAKFKSKLSLDDHVIRKHPEFIASVSRKIHECPICFYKTVNSTSFNRHTSRHSKHWAQSVSSF